MNMGAKPPVFIDTNIMLRYLINDFPEYPAIRHTVDTLIREEHILWASRQVIREFGRVCTRPQSFMQVMSPQRATDYMDKIGNLFEIADEDVRVTQQLILLMRQFSVSGKQVHDANIVATMQAYHIPNLLTLNLKDFDRYQSVIHLMPLSSP
jgi:predicted nucleic acid-binding protein